MWYYSCPGFINMKELPFYIAGLGKHDLQPYTTKPEGHPRHQFFYCEKGSGKLKIYDRIISIPPGSGFYIPADIPHIYYPLEDVWDLRWISCGGSGISSLCGHIGIKPGNVYMVENAAALDAIQNRMHMKLIHDDEYGGYFAAALLNEFILEFARQCGLLPVISGIHTADNIYEKSMDLIREYVEYHFMYKITLDELCNLVHVSPQHLCRIVKNCTGKRVTEYINIVRIEKAKDMLVSTSETIETVSICAGFDNCNYFCKIFKKLMGMTPKEYRMNNKKTVK